MHFRMRIAAVATIALSFTPLPRPAAASGQDDPATQPEHSMDRIVVIGSQPTTFTTALEEVAMTPGGTELIDMEDFHTRNVSSLADVLRYVPGLWAASDSGNDTMFFTSRGSNLDATDYDMNGIKLLEDGLPITTADGNNHNRIVDPLIAQHVTVARGANAMKYGASTLGGAMNFVSSTAESSDTLAMSLAGGSFGQRLGRVTTSNAFGDSLDGLLTVESKEWEGYREHNRQKRNGFYGNAGWRLTDSLRTRFYGTWIENEEQLPGSLNRAQVAADPGQADPGAIGGNYQVNVNTWRLANKTSWFMDRDRSFEIGFSIEKQALYHPIVDRVLVDFDGPGPAEPIEVFSLLIDTDQRNIGSMLRYRHRVGAHDLLFGLNYGASSVNGGNYRNLAGLRNGLTTRIDNDATLMEAFAMDRWTLNERLSLVLAAQSVLASRNVRNLDIATGILRSPDGDYSSINPRLGLLYEVGEDASLYANVSRLYEPPTNYQLEDNVAGGDAALDAMEGTVVEIGTRGQRELGQAGSLSWDLSLYHAWIRNEILSVEDPAAPGTSLSTNIGDTVHAGLEGAIRARFAFGEGLFIEPVLSVSVNRFHFDDDEVYGNNRLPAAPAYAVRGEVIYRDDRGLYFGPTFEIAGKRYADFVNGYVIDGYTLAGWRAGWTGTRWSVYADVINVLDEQYIANHSVRNAAAPDDAILNPGAPLSAYVGVRWQLQ